MALPPEDRWVEDVAAFLVRTLGLYPDTTRINIVYNCRGLWSVLAVWFVGHWWGNTERHIGKAAFRWRIAGAILLLGAIVVAVMLPVMRSCWLGPPPV